MIVKFNDYQCPPCRGTYFAYEPVVAKYKDRPQDVSFMLKHFPLNPKCNPGVTNQTHPAACDAAAAAVMAQSLGTFDKLTDWFFMHQNELTPATVRRAAADVGGIKDFDARYDRRSRRCGPTRRSAPSLASNPRRRSSSTDARCPASRHQRWMR